MRFGRLGRGFGRLGAGAGVAASDPAEESLALFAAMTSEPDAARKSAIDTLVKSLKSADIWDDLDVLYLLAAHDSQAALLNWKNPEAFTGLLVNAPTFTTDRGFAGNGSTSRIRTQYTPSVDGVNYTQNDASLWAWNRTAGQVSGAVEAGNQTSPRVRLLVRNEFDQASVIVNDATASVISSTNDVGFWGVTRSDSANKKMFFNGVQLGSNVAVASTAVASQEQWICGANSTLFSTRQIAAAAWGASLAGKELAFHNSINTYMQAVGAA